MGVFPLPPTGPSVKTLVQAAPRCLSGRGHHPPDTRDLRLWREWPHRGATAPPDPPDWRHRCAGGA
eukprot:5606492-Alexandrium_andersonii.AAC.1